MASANGIIFLYQRLSPALLPPINKECFPLRIKGKEDTVGFASVLHP